MSEVTVDRLTYSGSDLAAAVAGEMDGSRTLSHLRLEAFVDTDELRDPYVVTMSPGHVEDDFDVGRAWPLSQHVTFGLFAVPNEPVSGDVGSNTPYYQGNETHLGTVSVFDGDDSPKDLAFDGDVELHFTGTSGPTEQRVGGNLKRTPAIQSAMQDFEGQADDGLDFVDKSVVVDVADALSSRLDTTGVDGQPDGYPDGAVDLVDQDWHGYCASASLLFNFAHYFPRRVVEICRSLYQPMPYHLAGFRGYLTFSITFERTAQYLNNVYTYQRTEHGRTEEAAFVDLIQTMLRETLDEVRTHHQDVDDVPSDSDGMNAVESEAMMNELMILSRTYTTGYNTQSSRGGVTPLRAAQAAVEQNDLNTISLDAELVDPETSLPQEASVDHAITLLDSNVPPATVAAAVPDPIEIVFQNPWGGEATRQSHPKDDIKTYVANVTVGER